MMHKEYLFAIGLVIIILILVIVVLHFTQHIQQVGSQKSSVATRAPLPKETVITLTKSGFSPNQITVRVDTAVRWKNESGAKQTVNSDNYPTNQLHRQLNFGVFANDSSFTYTFKTPGVYGYHNQFNHTQEGKVIVVQ